jgi:hypothetical protein
MDVRLTETHVNIELTPFEKVASLRGDLRIPLKDIAAVEVDRRPFDSLRGRLLRGLRVPRRRYVATSGLGRGRLFWAIDPRWPALKLTLENGRFSEVRATVADPEGLARRIDAARAAA